MRELSAPPPCPRSFLPVLCLALTHPPCPSPLLCLALECADAMDAGAELQATHVSLTSTPPCVQPRAAPRPLPSPSPSSACCASLRRRLAMLLKQLPLPLSAALARMLPVVPHQSLATHGCRRACWFSCCPSPPPLLTSNDIHPAGIGSALSVSFALSREEEEGQKSR